MNELILAQQSVRIFGKDAIYKPGTDNIPCRVVVDSGVDQMADTPFRDTTLTYLVSVIGKHVRNATIEVPELQQTYRIGELVDDDGYLRTVQVARV